MKTAIQGAGKSGDVSNIARLFHAVSYLQYPLLLVTLFYVILPCFTGLDELWQALNKALIFAGLAISFSTLQDTTTTQNNFSKKIWQDPRKGKLALLMLTLTAAMMLLVGLYGFLASTSGVINDLAIGMLMLGIGYIGLLKTAIEMYENHRTDKHDPEAIR
jgi:hypothetical protein